MWVRQCDLDAENDFLPPIPSRIASNEEFVPPPMLAISEESLERFTAVPTNPFKLAGVGELVGKLAIGKVPEIATMTQIPHPDKSTLRNY